MPVIRSAATLALAAIVAGCTRTVVVTRPEGQRRPPPAATTTTTGPSTAATLGVPPGHLPPPGQCRVWIPGRPPGRQARPAACAALARRAPAGSWILYRPTEDRRLVHVRVVDDRRPGVVIRIRVFEIESGRFVREENP